MAAGGEIRGSCALALQGAGRLADRCLLARSARLLRGVLARAGASTEPAQPCVCLRVGEHLGRVKVHHLKQLKRDARVILPNAHRAQEQQHARRCARQPFWEAGEPPPRR